jgi:hypothetical protein
MLNPNHNYIIQKTTLNVMVMLTKLVNKHKKIDNRILLSIFMVTTQ